MDIPQWLADTFGGVTIGQIIVWVVVIVLALIGLRKIWPGIKAIVQFADTWSKLPAFMKRTDEAIAKQDEVLGKQSTQLDGIFHETHRNDGSSIKDSTVRLEAAVEGLHGRLDQVEASNDRQEQTLTDVQGKLTRDHERLNELEDTIPHDQVRKLADGE